MASIVATPGPHALGQQRPRALTAPGRPHPARTPSRRTKRGFTRSSC